MADFEFSVTSGPFQATPYEIDMKDLSGVDVLDARKVLGIGLVQAASQGMDIDVVSVLVWLVKRRANRGLAFNAVADSINYGNVDFDVKAPSAGEAGSVDPTTSGISDDG